jgi:transposase
MVWRAGAAPFAKEALDGGVYAFRAKRADRLKMIWWDGTGLVKAHKRLEQNALEWPTIRDGAFWLDPAQLEALFAGLDWRRVTALENHRPISLTSSTASTITRSTGFIRLP